MCRIVQLKRDGPEIEGGAVAVAEAQVVVMVVVRVAVVAVAIAMAEAAAMQAVREISIIQRLKVMQPLQ